MEYTLKLAIARPRAEVARLFCDRGRLLEWQPSLKSIKLTRGSDNAAGAQYEQRNAIGAMRETVVKNELPNEYTVTYEIQNWMGCAWNLHRNLFAERSANATEWTVVNKFECRGAVWLMAKLAPWLFKIQTRGYMKAFKRFAESR